MRCQPGKSCADPNTSAVFGVWSFRLGGNNGAAEGAAAGERWPGLSWENASGESCKRAMSVKDDIAGIAISGLNTYL